MSATSPAAPGSYQLAGFLQKKGAKDVRPASSGEFMFEVVTPTRTYELQASSAAEVETWISTLKVAMAGDKSNNAAAPNATSASSEETDKLKSEVDDLKRQLSSKDQEIADLQKQLAAAKTAASQAPKETKNTPPSAASVTTESDADKKADSTPPPAAKDDAPVVVEEEKEDPIMKLLKSEEEGDRLKAIEQYKASSEDDNQQNNALYDQKLTELLADSSEAVQKAAAETLWFRQKDSHCSRTVESLRDEIRGHCMVDGKSTGLTLSMGREKATQALDVLLKYAPGGEKEELQKIIDETVIIESKISDGSPPPGAVEFVETVTKGKYVYEVHRSDKKEYALAFLKSKPVTEKLYYIEVETPAGTFGRDIEGMYDL